MSNTANTNEEITLSDKTMEYVNLVLDDFREGGRGEDPINRVLDFLVAAVESPKDATDAYLEYFTDTTDGEEFLAKYGVDGTHGDMREFVQDRLAKQ